MSDLEESTQSEQSGQRTPRTAAATRGKIRAAENRMAAKLEERGWICLPPEVAERGRALLAEARPETK